MSNQATIGATIKFNATCPNIQAANNSQTFGASAEPIMASMKAKAPPTSHGVRRPNRDFVLSDKAPATMFEIAATIIASVENIATNCTLCALSSCCNIAGKNKLDATMYGPSQVAGPIISPGTNRRNGISLMFIIISPW